MRTKDTSTAFKETRFVFIAGAPRSGTTLLGSLLDDHPNLLGFRTEHSTIERFFQNQHRIDSYARTDFINVRKEGQQTLLANQDFLKQKQEAINAEYGKSIDLSHEFDTQTFKSSYVEYLEGKTIDLETMLKALACAQTAACSYSKQHFSKETKYFIFKQPFYTELFAQKVAEKIPNARFIHILREPIARYTSAKTRRIKQCELKKKRLGPINRMSYVTGHTAIDIATRRLAENNSQQLGQANYKTLHFEQLVETPLKAVESILTWLDLDSDRFQIRPTRQGQSKEAGSVLTNSNKVESTTSNRLAKYHQITGWNERKIHKFLLESYIEQKPTSALRLINTFLVQLPNSTVKNYLCQLSDLSRCIFPRSARHLERFLDKAQAGNADLSGAT